MNQNWIVENLNNAFSTWNGKLTELWGLVTTSPQTFKGGAVWGVMQSLHNAMIGIGYPRDRTLPTRRINMITTVGIILGRVMLKIWRSLPAPSRRAAS